MRAHGVSSKAEIADRSAEVLRMVGIDPVHLRSYPHQLSGGMRQRAMIAMAMLFTPELVIMDEPTSALDVVAQRSLMVQIKELQQQLGFAVIFVTHDMSLVSHFSDRLMVMYAGQVAEFGTTRDLFDRAAAPVHGRPARRLPVDPRPAGAADRHPGQPARPGHAARRAAGSSRAARKAMERCASTQPELYQVDGTTGALPAARGRHGRGEDHPVTSPSPNGKAQADDGTAVGPPEASARSGDRGVPAGRPPRKQRCCAPTS